MTAAEIADRRAYANLRNALGALFSLGAVPVVNENDATATDEITFGDNDALAAQVAVLLRARLLVLLTSVEGVLTHAPDDVRAELIVDGAAARAAVLGRATASGKGGMQSKIAAAEMASAAGIATVIAAGDEEAVLPPIVAGEPRGTLFEDPRRRGRAPRGRRVRPQPAGGRRRPRRRQLPRRRRHRAVRPGRRRLRPRPQLSRRPRPHCADAESRGGSP